MRTKTDSPLRKAIIRRLQQAILDSGMTYSWIAKETGTHADTIAKYMCQKPKLPSAEILAALCPVLGVSADWIILGEEETR